MATKKEFEAPDYSKITTEDEAEKLLAQAKTDLHRKVKQQLATKENKKTEMASYNEAIKELGEEIDHLVGVVDALISHKKQIQAGVGLRAV